MWTNRGDDATTPTFQVHLGSVVDVGCLETQRLLGSSLKMADCRGSWITEIWSLNTPSSILKSSGLNLKEEAELQPRCGPL